MKKYIFLFALCSFSLTSACSKEVTRESIVGIYDANHKLAKDILEIKKDGTYDHHYQVKGSKEYTYTGKWELEKWDGEQLLTFENWYSPKPLGMEPEIMGKKVGVGARLGRWPAHVEWRAFGKPRICIDEDSGYYYQKR